MLVAEHSHHLNNLQIAAKENRFFNDHPTEISFRCKKGKLNSLRPFQEVGDLITKSMPLKTKFSWDAVENTVPGAGGGQFHSSDPSLQYGAPSHFKYAGMQLLPSAHRHSSAPHPYKWWKIREKKEATYLLGHAKNNIKHRSFSIKKKEHEKKYLWIQMIWLPKLLVK